ncbi:glycosylhydrolase-like jelly roll fold domain-containing protein [Jiangella alkaliphila]|uniref:Beta-mannosidase-like galactose-binding domain-containing protein n=1 Tax=Jiangella alkaliphila TaxID=419479 RepID=A0A1H2LJW9_9ACTN|nr:glycosyl hydrolase [Jiangella alkaliphila]SDU81219.1 hypothetical protein SAMN04488563_6287 [Jiangella alkaliphila]
MNDNLPDPSTGVVVSRRTVLAIATAAAAAAGLGTGTLIPVFAAPPEPGTGFDAGRFADPPADSRPVILWFWNGPVTPALVDAQLADMRSQGVEEVLVFPFDTTALRPHFFTEEWFAIIEHTLREADRHGMHIWLFNDDLFPSGRAGGFVVNGGQVGDRVYEPRPDLRPNGIVRATTVVDGGGPVDLDALRNRGLAVQDGKLVVDARRRDGVTVLRDGAEWQDYDVTATVRTVDNNAGLLVRCADAANGYLTDLRADGGVDVWRQVDGRFTLLRVGQAAGGHDPAAYHVLRVQVRGDRILPSLDGRALPEVVDATFARGRVGVRATATQHSLWDALAVTGADGAQLYASQFDDASALDAFDLPPDETPLVAVAARPESGSDAAAVVDLTALAREGRGWDAPAGRWQVDVFTGRELADHSGNFRRNYLDVLDDEAMGLFLDIVPGEYLRRFGWAVGGVLRGFADDEPFIASADAHFHLVPWSRSLEAELERLGTTPAVALSAVHDELGREGRRLRGVFWRAVSNRFASAYYEQQGRWMADHDVAFISNPLYDEYGPAEQLKSTGNLNTANQWAQVPGTDLVFDHYQRGYHRTLSRWAASTAHQLGLERVYLEGMGAMGWGVTPSLVREVIGAFAARGVNQTLLHATFTDSATIFYPPPFQPVNPWWNLSRPLNEWIGRAMEAGRATAPARTALLQPQRAAESSQDTPAMAELDTAFVGAVHALEDAQVDFDLVDEGALDADPALLEHAQARGGRLVVGRQEYRIVVLSQTPILSLGAVRTLTGFVRGGGVLVAVGDLPSEEAGGDDAGLGRALQRLFSDPGAGRATRAGDAAEAAAAVAAAGGAAAALFPPVGEVRVLRLDRGGEPGFLVVNERAEEVAVTATFPATGVPEVWDPDTGDAVMAGVWRLAPFPADPRGGTAVPLRLGPKATVLVVFRDGSGGDVAHAVYASAPVVEVSRDAAGPLATVSAAAPGPVSVVAEVSGRLYRGEVTVEDPLAAVALDGDWTFRFERDGATAVPRPLGSWTDLDPRHSGSATYETEIDLDAATLGGRSWTLDLGSVLDVAEVSVNGESVATMLWAPYRADVTDLLRPGRNAVRVRVTNTGANVRGQALASGLLGPVILRPHVLVEVPLSSVRGRVLDVDAAAPAVAPGQPRPVTVRVSDLSRRSGDVTLEVSGEGLAVSPASVPVRLDRSGVGSAEITLDAPLDSPLPGQATLVVRAEGVERRLSVALVPATRLGTATASSTHPAHPAATAIDGIVDSTLWEWGQGWNDNTPNAHPDDLTVTFDLPATVGRVRVFTLDSAQYPAARFGIMDADVSVLVDGSWRTAGQIRGNDQGLVEVTFPAVRAEAVRLSVLASRATYSRVIEVEARPA